VEKGMREDVVGEGEAGRSQAGGSSAMSSSAERFEYASLRVNKQELTHKEEITLTRNSRVYTHA
jgi:hypothetical protein